ncbi:hypothetical protein JCM17845_08050 [Iodidimonas gelatinilytica]|uniref:Uncharacterized protein n=1 Tax=Iodidimonas gelatinilytica TaxID=1236966 RepID=A0A5A7MW81_9PROT|nr:hypothetical protein [Iodidimonas gelatinilytica]GER00182.1 hypothetical protein JCM17845_08050 [Iodidimonas gelatinilytica]
MDNPYIALGSLLAISALVLLNWLLGGWSRAKITTKDQAVARYGQDFWEQTPNEAVLDQEGRAALLTLSGTSALGLVVAQGGHFITRHLDIHSLRAVQKDGDSGLVIQLQDFALPRIRIILETPKQQDLWHDRLAMLVHQKHPMPTPRTKGAA